MSYSHFGVHIDTHTISEIHTILAGALQQVTPVSPIVLFTPNPELLVLARRQPEYAALLNSATINIPDGQGLVWLSGGQLTERVTGSDVVTDLLEQVHSRANELQNITSSVGVVVRPDGLMSKSEISRRLQSRYPRISLQIIEPQETFSTAPAVVISALGFPDQERWVIDHMSDWPEVRIWIAAGATIDFLVGAQRRAPRFFRKFGVEWLWRLALQPRRIKRICVAVLVFPALTLWDRLRGRYFTKL